MKVFAYERFHRAYRELPSAIQRKVDKQLALLVANPRHPSLQVKRVRGTEGIWEARMDLHHRPRLRWSPMSRICAWSATTTTCCGIPERQARGGQ